MNIEEAKRTGPIARYYEVDEPMWGYYLTPEIYYACDKTFSWEHVNATIDRYQRRWREHKESAWLEFVNEFEL